MFFPSKAAEEIYNRKDRKNLQLNARIRPAKPPAPSTLSSNKITARK